MKPLGQQREVIKQLSSSCPSMQVCGDGGPVGPHEEDRGRCLPGSVTWKLKPQG